MDHSEDFENGKLFPMIVRYSVPAAISLLITAIYNIVDRIFVGNYCGTSALAGLSVCFPLSFLMMAVGLNCSAGGATLFSLFRGRGEKKDMSRSFGNSYLMVVVLELLLSAILLLFAEPILMLFGATDTCYTYALAYYRIVAVGCVFQGISQVCCDFVRVSGKPVLGMCVTSIGAVTNIILDFLFVAVLDMGVEGFGAFGGDHLCDLGRRDAVFQRTDPCLRRRRGYAGYRRFRPAHQFYHHSGAGIYHAGDHLLSVPGKTIAFHHHYGSAPDCFSDSVYLPSAIRSGNQRNLLGAADQ